MKFSLRSLVDPRRTAAFIALALLVGFLAGLAGAALIAAIDGLSDSIIWLEDQLRWGRWLPLLTVPLGLGIVIAMLSMSKLITNLMLDHPGPTYASFFGLILASSWIPLARARTRGWKRWFALALAAISAWWLVGLQAGPIELRVTRSDPGATVAIYAAKLRSGADLASIEDAAETSTIAVFDPKGMCDKPFKAETVHFKIISVGHCRQQVDVQIVDTVGCDR